MGKLEVILYQANNLSLSSIHGYNDPSCSLTVGRTTSQVSAPRSQNIKTKNNSPVWNQKLQFEVNPNEPSEKYLYFQVFDVDDSNKQNKIGDVWIPLEGLTMGREVQKWYPLQSPSSGEVRIGLIAHNFDTNNNIQIPTQQNYSASQPNYYPPFSHQIPTHEQNPTPTHSLPQIPVNYPQNQQNNVNRNYQFPQHPISPEIRPSTKPESNSLANKSLVKFEPTDLQRDFPYIAKGSFGVVYKGHAKGINGSIVIKDMEIQNQKSVEGWKKEIAVMSQYRSPFVVEVFGYCSHHNVLTIVMEYMANGDLYHVLHKNKEQHPLSLIQRMRMARHCALGLAFLHVNRVIHRDVKSMNILVTEEYACKLTDFGCARLISGRQIYLTMNSGTPLWMSPEVKLGQYNFSADVYSLGLVLYELFERKLPAWDQVKQIAVVPPSFQSETVVKPCLNLNPDKRPSANQVVQVLDKMIHNILNSVRTLLPENEQEHLKNEAKRHSTDGKDSLELELTQLYKHLLCKQPAEVDLLISKAFQINLDQPHQGSYQPNSLTQPKPQQQPAVQQPPPYQNGRQPVIQQPVIQQPNQNGRQPTTQQPIIQQQYMPGYAPYQSKGYTQPYGYQQAYYTPPSQRFPNGVQQAPPSYIGRSNTSAEAPPPYQQKDPEMTELESYLQVLTPMELRNILVKNNIETHSIPPTEFINKIKETCAASVLNDLRAFKHQSLPKTPAVSQAPTVQHNNNMNYQQQGPDMQFAAKSISLYISGKEISNDAAILCLSDLLSNKMESKTVRDTVSILFENYDQGNKGYIGLQEFLEMYKNLWEMCGSTRD